MTALATAPRTLLQVGDWSSSCSSCGWPADTRETRHRTRLGIAAQPGGCPPPGCGRTYVAVALRHDAAAAVEDGACSIAAALRLPYVGRQAPAHPGTAR